MDTWGSFPNAEGVGAVLTSCLFSPPRSLHFHLWLRPPACLSSSCKGGDVCPLSRLPAPSSEWVTRRFKDLADREQGSILSFL